MALAGGTWTHTDLTVRTGAPTPGAFDGELRGLRPHRQRQLGGLRQRRRRGAPVPVGPRTGAWTSQNLTGDSGEPRAALQGLACYVRTDGLNAIVYRGEDEHLYELTEGSGGEFDVLNDLTAMTGAAPATGHVHAFNRTDGTSTVIYEGPDFHIHELTLEGGSSLVPRGPDRPDQQQARTPASRLRPRRRRHRDRLLRPRQPHPPTQAHLSASQELQDACPDAIPAPFECATAQVPLDYEHPKQRTIGVVTVRRPAQQPTARIGSLFINPGGPGGDGIDYRRADLRPPAAGR